MTTAGTDLAVAGLDGELPPAWSADLRTAPVPEPLLDVLELARTAAAAEPAGGVDALLVVGHRPWLLVGVGTTVRGRPRGDGARAASLVAEAVRRAGSPVPVRVVDTDALPAGERVRLAVRCVEHEQDAGRVSTSYALPLPVWIVVVATLVGVCALIALADGVLATVVGVVLAGVWVVGTLLAVAEWGDTSARDADRRRGSWGQRVPGAARLGALAVLVVVAVRLLDAVRG